MWVTIPLPLSTGTRTTIIRITEWTPCTVGEPVVCTELISQDSRFDSWTVYCYTVVMTRDKAWSNYFETGEIDPLIRAYWDSVQYIAWSKNLVSIERQEDMFQWGMIGLIKGIKSIDPSRTKSKDAWIWMNVKGMMFNHYKSALDIDARSLDEELKDDLLLSDLIADQEIDLDMRMDLLQILKTSANSEEAKEKLIAWGYYPSINRNKDHYLKQYHDGNLSLNGLARELGVSKRQAYKLIDKLPASW